MENGVRFHLFEKDIPLIAAVLAPVVHEQRGRFVAEHNRLPNDDELRQMQNGIINDWYRLIDRLQQDRRDAGE